MYTQIQTPYIHYIIKYNNSIIQTFILNIIMDKTQQAMQTMLQHFKQILFNMSTSLKF